MKKLLAFCALLSVLACSCSGWVQSDADAFHQACMDDAKTWMKDSSKAELYCKCVSSKVLERYNSIKNAVDSIEFIASEPTLQTCRTAVQQ